MTAAVAGAGRGASGSPGGFALNHSAIPGMCAHPTIDPRTGELVLFRYAFQEPYLMWAAIASDGSVAHPPEPIPVDGPYMIHDMVLTERYVVLFVAPAVFDMMAARKGKGLSDGDEQGMLDDLAQLAALEAEDPQEEG